MKTHKIITPQRRNSKLFDIGFENDALKVVFESECRKTFLTIEFGYRLNTYEIFSYSSGFETIKKFIAKKYHDKMSADEVESFFYTLQKRLKGQVKLEADEIIIDAVAEESKPRFPAEVEDVKFDDGPRVPETKAKVVEVKIDRPESVGLEGQIHDLVYSCLESEFTTQTLTNAMIKLGIEPNRVELIIKEKGKDPVNVGAQHRDFKKIMQTISAGVNIALVGPAGSGKTTTVRKVSEALKLPFYSQSVSSQTGTHDFFGYNDAHGNYVSTLFRSAYENGGVFLLDEFDAGSPNVLASLNQATANGHYAFANGMVERHKDFIVVMAGNTFGHGATSEYVGRNKIDAATLDRFAFIFFDYDEDFEMSLATNKSWCKIVQEVRGRVKSKKIKTIVSPRATFDGGKLLEVGMSIEDVKEMLIYKGLTEDERNLLTV